DYPHTKKRYQQVIHRMCVRFNRSHQRKNKQDTLYNGAFFNASSFCEGRGENKREEEGQNIGRLREQKDLQPPSFCCVITFDPVGARRAVSLPAGRRKEP
ncbi:MAG: hypothetical protein ABID83_03630, partial [Candidatus Omnitrophota bacterium]